MINQHRSMIELIKQLRQETGASIGECQKALNAANGDYEQAKEWLKKNYVARAEKKSDRQTSEGIVVSYIHGNSKIGSLVKLLCETDFVARNPEFKELGQELAMQVAAMRPEENQEVNVAWLLAQPYIKDPNTTIENLVKEKISKLGENITIGDITRFEI